MIGYLSYDPMVHLNVGPLSISPHGIGIAVGFLAGALVMRPQARRRGIPDELLYTLLTRAAIGAVAGARVAYVANHLGKPTEFALGYVCPAADTASPCVAAVGDAVHQPALYDLASVTLLLGALLLLRRRPRYDGFLILVFAVWYGTGRFLEDFFRIDVTHGTGLTGSQWTSLVAVLAAGFVLVVRRRTPAIGRWSHPPDQPDEDIAHADHR